jgi:hypothetical protein
MQMTNANKVFSNGNANNGDGVIKKEGGNTKFK